MPTLLQILPKLESGGVERGTIDIAAAAQNAGFTSLVASSGGRMVAQLNEKNIEHITLPLDSKNPLQIIANARSLNRLISEYKVDIIHARSRAPAWSGYFAARNKAHFVTTFHGLYSHGNALKRFYNSVMTRGEKVIAISDFIAAHLRDVHKVPEDKIVTIPRGADLELFNPARISEAQKNELRSKWQIDDRPLVFLPGRFTRWKGQHYLLEALRNMPKGSVQCVLAGNLAEHPDYVSELRNFAENYLKGQVRIVDAVSDIASAYAISDVVISTSLRPEAFGRIATEAQAMGATLVATKLGGSIGTIRDGITGFLAPADDPRKFAEILGTALALRAAEREIMGKNAREHIKQHFSLQQMCQKTIDLYSSTIK